MKGLMNVKAKEGMTPKIPRSEQEISTLNRERGTSVKRGPCLHIHLFQSEEVNLKRNENYINYIMNHPKYGITDRSKCNQLPIKPYVAFPTPQTVEAEIRTPNMIRTRKIGIFRRLFCCYSYILSVED